MTTAYRRAALLATVLLAAGTMPAVATTIRVPEDYATVLAGVDAAFPGDSVLVGPGTWTALATRVVVIFGSPETITACAFPRGGVTILGPAGRDATILDASVEDSGAGILTVILFADRLGDGPLVLEGLTVTGARRPTGAQALAGVNSDGLIVRSCRFYGNESDVPQGASAGAAIAGTDCSVEIVDSQIDHDLSIGGVVLVFDSSLTIRGCRFEENRGQAVQLDAESELSAVVLIEDSDFVRNRGGGFGTAVDLTSTPVYTIRRCRFVENVAEDWSGAAVRLAATYGRIEYCVFERDSCLAATSHGGGVSLEQSSGYVLFSTFVGCHAARDGAAFSALQGGVRFANNIVAYSTGGAAVDEFAAPNIGGCNDYWANAGGDFGQWWTPSATDFFVDPLFVDPPFSDYTVREDSPCMVGDCGQVGALGIGCESLAVEPRSWSKIKGLYR